ncbi:MAG: RNA polymerase factor sigma-32 [Deltaproteobacteria bacterium]|nr:RNA polymerase factor sigma-32 [Deltaproteobacteria bacterium]
MKKLVQATTGSISTYMAEVSRYPLLTPDEEREITTRYRKTGDPEAAWKIVTANLRFVVKVAHEYVRYGVRLNDLVQEGNLGLMKAVQKFDPDRGYRFISYAVWWVRAYIQSYILKTWSLVKIGTTQAQRKLFFSLSRARREVARLGGGDPLKELTAGDIKSISGRLNVKGDDVREMDLRMRGRDVSLDAALSEDSEGTRLDLTADPGSDFQDEVITREDGIRLREKIKAALANLPRKERYIVENRVMADEPMTLEEIGKVFGITRERVRQLESRAMKLMKGTFAEFAPAC